MPRTIHPDLLDCLRRPNPNVELRTEISAPDVGQTYRRKDQFEGAGRVSLSPAASMVVSANGALQLAPTGIALANFPDTSGTTAFDLNKEDPSRRYKGLSWLVDPSFARATLKTFTARIGRTGSIFSLIPTDFELHIHRVTKIPGVTQTTVAGQVTGVTAFTQYVFSDVLSSPVLIKAANIAWVGNRATLVFDLSQYGVVVDNSPNQATHPDQVGELPNYYFVVRSVNAPNTTGLFFWCQDLVTTPTVAGVGTFSKVFWARDSDTQQWSPNTTAPSNPPSSTITVESFATTSTAIYSIDLGRAPGAGSVGRVVFERSLPPGTLATLELSTAGSGGPWTSVKHGDAPALAQQTYHLRLIETSDTPSHRSSPGVNVLGIEYRTITDISVESILSLPSREIATPFLAASIPEATVKVLRIGSRDYLDVATSLGSSQSPPKLEAEIYLASRHPAITRDKWLRLERMPITNRNPSSSAEDFTLLSYASKLKRKIPGKVETINTVHTVVAGSDATKILVSPNLLSPAPGDNTLYDGKHYYMRVQKTSGSGLPQGYTQEIQGNTGQAQIDFSPNLPAALATGDTIEVHSGIFNTQSINWVDYDPADVWWEIMTVYANPPIPPERIGQGFLPRGGRPPHVTDRAPGDATTQAKLKVTMRLTEQEPCDQLLDQVSLIMGGATVEIDGQMCFVQVYPLRAADGTISVPLPPVAAVFDIRDYTGLATPPGLEDRATVLSANYGVNKAAANPDSFPSKTTVVVDNDALSWLTQQDLEDVGSSELPDNISRWLYNSPGSGGDEGLYLATTVGVQIVRAISTGKRVFNLQPIEVQPHLIPGDPVILITDAYTDYDPASGVAVKGWLAIRGVTVRVANQGRLLGIYILGLAENVTQVAGGASGALTGLGGQPAPPTLSASFDTAGHIIINSAGDFATASQKIAYGSGAAPSAATVRAQTAIAQQIVSGLVEPTVYAPGDTVYVAAFAYSANGLESSPLVTISVTRQGSGTAAPPSGSVLPLNTEANNTTRDLRFLANAGSGGGGTNLTYDIRLKWGFLPETSIASGNGTTLPRDLTVNRDVEQSGAGRYILTDVATGLVTVIPFVVPSQRAEVTTVGGILKFKRTVNFTDGDNAAAGDPSDTTGRTLTTTSKESGLKEVRRLLAKTLPADPDTADSVVNGILKRAVPFTVLRASDDFLLSGVHDAAALGTGAGRATSLASRQIGTTTFIEDFSGFNADGVIDTNTWPDISCPQTNDFVFTSSWSTRGRRIGVFGGDGTHFNYMNWGNNLGQPAWVTFDPNKLYRIRARWMVNIDPTNGGGKAVYIGVRCFDTTGSPANNNNGNAYVCVLGTTATLGVAQINTGWFKGASFPFASGSPVVSTDPRNPTPLSLNTVFMQPIMLLNYPSGNGQIVVDYLEITEYDEVAAAALYASLDETIPGRARSAFQESGGKAMNRLLAKTLAGDADSMDGAPDGVTYKKIVSVNGSGQITPPSSAPRNRVKATRTSAQSISNASITAIDWTGTDAWDSNNLHDPASNPSRIVVPSGGNIGAWILTGQVSFANNSTGLRSLYIYKNGGTRLKRVNAAGINIASVGNYMEITAIDDAPAVGDYYELLVEQTSGIALNASPAGEDWFAATHIW
jgi:hypothetical protein